MSSFMSDYNNTLSPPIPKDLPIRQLLSSYIFYDAKYGQRNELVKPTHRNIQTHEEVCAFQLDTDEAFLTKEFHQFRKGTLLKHVQWMWICETLFVGTPSPDQTLWFDGQWVGEPGLIKCSLRLGILGLPVKTWLVCSNLHCSAMIPEVFAQQYEKIPLTEPGFPQVPSNKVFTLPVKPTSSTKIELRYWLESNGVPVESVSLPPINSGVKRAYSITYRCGTTRNFPPGATLVITVHRDHARASVLELPPAR